MNVQELNNLLSGIVDVNIDSIQNYELNVSNISFLKLRDVIIELGRIYAEDAEKQVYIVRIYGGFFKKNPTITAFHLEGNRVKIAISVREGIINQHTCEDVINEIKRRFKYYT